MNPLPRFFRRDLVPRLVLASLMALAVILFFALDLHHRLTLTQLQAQAESLRQQAAARPLPAAAIFFGIYVAVTGLGLPGAAVMSLAGGAIFGLVLGAVLISFASTLGAVLSCLAARYLLRHWVQERFAAQLTPINAGIEHEGAFYLFTMRLIPALPFFAINLVMGLTPMPMRTYAWVSQMGMLPATLVFAYAGTQIIRVRSLSDVLSPGLLAAFVLLGLLPLCARRLISWLRRRRQNCSQKRRNP